MPESCCHPVAAHRKLRIADTDVSSLMLDRAIDAIERKLGTIDRSHDIPYLAGYSADGKRIYIDRHLPPTFKDKGKAIAVDRFLLLHEEVEKTLIDQLGLHYQHAHQIATRAEEAAVRADNVSWRNYNRFMMKYVKAMGDERLGKLPPDLDLKPYRDEHDYDLMKRMQAAVKRLAPKGKRDGLAKALDKALSPMGAAAGRAAPAAAKPSKQGARPKARPAAAPTSAPKKP